MQEELLHKTLGKQAKQLEANEKARRINESQNVTEEDDKRQKTIDMLIGVQKQLLDVMAKTEVLSLQYGLAVAEWKPFRRKLKEFWVENLIQPF